MIVVASDLAEGWLRVLRAGGISARVGTLAEALRREAAVIPSDVRLFDDQLDALDEWVRGGATLVTPHQRVLRHLGVERSEKTELAELVADRDRAQRSVLSPPVEVSGVMNGDDIELRSVARSGPTIVAGAADVDDGTLVALAVDPLAGSRTGHELLPWLTEELRRLPATLDGPMRLGVEVYFDPGLLDLPPEEVADLLADVRAVHIAGWNGTFNDPDDNYDYDALIDELHARGVLAYAWLAPPFVDLGFWDRYPACREKTADGRDARVSWRSLIALEDEDCFERAWGEVWTPLIDAHDWDGVNIAELYFEPDVVPGDRTPFHPSALRRFGRGRSPSSAPEAFTKFRADLVVELNDKMLKQLNGHPKAAELELMVTVIDDQLDEQIATAVGTDVERLAEVARANGAALQVEDPFTVWGQSPLRYDRIVERLPSLADAGASVVDINVVDRPGTRPSERATGVELELAAAAAGVAGRVAFYAAGTIAPRDLAVMPRSIAGAAAVFDTGTDAPWTTHVRAPGGSAFGRLTVDGVRWPAGAGVGVVPPGEHRIEWALGAPASLGLTRLNAELGTARVVARGIEFSYVARTTAFATIAGSVSEVRVDSARLDAAAISPRGDVTIVRLPKGSHEVEMSRGS